MKLMLDTNVCIYLIKEHPASVVERFAAHPVGDIGISVITLAELEYGVTSSRPAKNRDALTTCLTARRGSLRPRGNRRAGRLRTALEKKGQRSVQWTC
jgi:tRNA(fMet)-specific endonuclease VapC